MSASRAHVAGIDEAGRGPLAGPVYAAAVILDPARPIRGLADSKLLRAHVRQELALLIQERAHAWSVARASIDEIDAYNILGATMLAMQRAAWGLRPQPELSLVDGNRCPVLPHPVSAIVKGDNTVPAISAASILAKVARDAEMLALDSLHPMYGFAAHKGYGTLAHLAALEAHGPCSCHRRSFEPVRRSLAVRRAVPFGCS